MDNNQDFLITHCTLFTTALCNLNCHYCYICKDVQGGLHNIDKDIEEDFKNKKYITQLLEYDENIKNSLESIVLWGGEPFLKIERFLDQIEDWFTTFPKVREISTSTNFVADNEIEKIQLLLNLIDQYYHGREKFTVDLQISIDGYTEMNDAGRGKGVTKQFLDNFNKLLNVSYNSDKIFLTVHTKPTLAKETFHFLDSQEKIKKWFTFFNDCMWKPYLDANQPWEFHLCLFNFAAPTEWTREDGQNLSNIIADIIAIQQEIISSCDGWKNYVTLNPVGVRTMSKLADKELIFSIKDVGTEWEKCKMCGGGCGSFVFNLIPITNNKYSMCHRGLFDAYVDYLNNMMQKDSLNGLSQKFTQFNTPESWVYTAEELKLRSQAMSQLYKYESFILYTDLIIFIREYAFAGIIDSKYTEVQNITPILDYFLGQSYCLQDAFLSNGSWVTISTNEIPLLFNGAVELTVDEIKAYLKKREQNFYDLSK